MLAVQNMYHVRVMMSFCVHMQKHIDLITTCNVQCRKGCVCKVSLLAIATKPVTSCPNTSRLSCRTHKTQQHSLRITF